MAGEQRGGMLNPRFLLLTVSLLAFSARAAEPANLDAHKDELRAYVKSGDYARDVAAVAAEARAWIEARVKQGGTKLTLVCDLDETLLSNWPELVADDFGGSEASWNAWMETSAAPAIEPVRKVYRVARELGIAVVFLTARGETVRAATERNLRAIDCGDYALLICKPESEKETSAEFKTAQRRRLADEGRTIIANIGDQESDLVGGFAERTFKLPCPFYRTR
jgi:predicted secreted acid phosphatase